MFPSPAPHAARPGVLHRRRGLLVAALGLALAATACVGPVVPRSVTLSLEQMQEKLGQRFPRRHPLAGLVELTLQVPRLTLQPAQNRIQAVVPLEAAGGALRSTITGRMDVDFALRYAPGDQTVRATDLQVHALQIDGLPPQTAQWLGRLGPPLAQQALRDVVLHQLRPRDLALADRLGLQPGRITVTAQGLEIELVPRPQP